VKKLNKHTSSATERLEKSFFDCIKQAARLGSEAGREWALTRATYLEFNRVASMHARGCPDENVKCSRVLDWTVEEYVDDWTKRHRCQEVQCLFCEPFMDAFVASVREVWDQIEKGPPVDLLDLAHADATGE